MRTKSKKIGNASRGSALIPALMVAALMAMLGGAGSLWGPIIGASILVPMRSYLGSWLGGQAGLAGLDLVIYGGIIMLIAAVQPRGVWGIVQAVRAKRRRT